MKKRIVKAGAAGVSIVAHLALPMLAVVALTVAAYAQQGAGSELKAKDAADDKAAREYIDRMENDQKYQDAIRNQPSAPTSNDPWGAVRPNTPPAAGAKPAAKTATGTKTASGTAKPASGTAKPAFGTASGAASATATPPKTQ
jgi:hypothetical protein